MNNQGIISRKKKQTTKKLFLLEVALCSVGKRYLLKYTIVCFIPKSLASYACVQQRGISR